MAKITSDTSVLIGSNNTLHKRQLKVARGDIVNVKSFGAKGDGANNDTEEINLAFSETFGTPTAPSHPAFIKTLFFPPGLYITNGPIHWTTKGGRVLGSGKYSTRIKNTTANSTVLLADSVRFSTIADLCLESVGGPGSICLDWSALTPGNLAGVPAYLFATNIALNGSELGLRLGSGEAFSGGGEQCSESMWLNCDFIDHAKWGVNGGNGNSLNHNFIGNLFQNCGISAITDGLTGPNGIPIIKGNRFINNCTTTDAAQVFNNFDINLGNANATWVVGNYSNSVNFFKSFGNGIYLVSNYHDSDIATDPFGQPAGFCHFGSRGGAIIDLCYSKKGNISSHATTDAASRNELYIRGSKFDIAPAHLASYAGGGTGGGGPGTQPAGVPEENI